MISLSDNKRELVFAGVVAELCVLGDMGLRSALHSVPAYGLQHLHCMDLCYHHLQNVVPAGINKPRNLLE